MTYGKVSPRTDQHVLFQVGRMLPSYLLLFFITRYIPNRVYIRNYLIEEIEMHVKTKPMSSLQSFVNFLSKLNSIGYVVLPVWCRLLAFLVSMCKLIGKIHKLIRKMYMPKITKKCFQNYFQNVDY